MALTKWEAHILYQPNELARTHPYPIGAGRGVGMLDQPPALLVEVHQTPNPLSGLGATYYLGRKPEYVQVGRAADLRVMSREGGWHAVVRGEVDLAELRVHTYAPSYTEVLTNPDRFGDLPVHPLLARDPDGWWFTALVLGSAPHAYAGSFLGLVW